MRNINFYSRLFVTVAIILLVAGRCAVAGEAVPSRLINDPVAPVIISVKQGAKIAAEGDSLTWGADYKRVLNRSPSPYPESLAAALDNKVTVENRGINGDRSIDGLEHWKDAGKADVVLLMYGTNDCGNFGHHPDGPVTLEKYREAMMELVGRRQKEGSRVIVLLPPPIGFDYAEEGMKAYRDVAVEVARSGQVDIFDTTISIKGIGNPWTDKLHLKPEAYKAIAADLADHIKVLP